MHVLSIVDRQWLLVYYTNCLLLCTSQLAQTNQSMSISPSVVSSILMPVTCFSHLASGFGCNMMDIIQHTLCGAIYGSSDLYLMLLGVTCIYQLFNDDCNLWRQWRFSLTSLFLVSLLVMSTFYMLVYVHVCVFYRLIFTGFNFYSCGCSFTFFV